MGGHVEHHLSRDLMCKAEACSVDPSRSCRKVVSPAHADHLRRRLLHLPLLPLPEAEADNGPSPP